MSNTEVGVLIDPAQPRDAIHIAVAPVMASMKLNPGCPIAFAEGSNSEVVNSPWPVSVGIVDPFLRAPVQKGQHFWMWLHPNTITSLRHDWTHPAFVGSGPGVGDIAKSEAWLRNYCNTADCPPYDDLMDAIRNGQSGSGYNSIIYGDTSISVSGQDASGTIPDVFWDHAEIVTGLKLKKRPEYFSCSC